tara:strand:+ start:2065 stop:2781 length:717 start_codon:yes stop_codon:yes gene_type:complete
MLRLSISIISALFIQTAMAIPVNVEGVREIIVQNNVSVTLSKGSKNARQVIPANVSVERTGSKLIITSDLDKSEPVKLFAKDNFKTLHKLRIQDDASLTANEIQSYDLKVKSESSGHLLLNQVKDVTQITNHGTGKVEVYWISVPKVSIISSQGNTILGGDVNNILLKSYGSAKVNASGLISKYAWLNTSDDAFVKVRVSKYISLIGSDRSLVESYRNVDHVNELTTDESALIHIRTT